MSTPSPPRRRLLQALALAPVAAAMPAAAGRSCGLYDASTQQCTAAIDYHRLPHLHQAQKGPVWCWAATLSMIFSWHGRRTSQESIVAQTFGSLLHLPADPFTLINAVNRPYVDDGGRSFRVSSKIWGPDYGRYELDAAGVVQSLAFNRPLVICNFSHMMTLVGVSYLDRGGAPDVRVGWVADPMLRGPIQTAPPFQPLPPGYRYLFPAELTPPPYGQLRFLADLSFN